MEHHTKDKGDIGLTKIIADLVERGFRISIPIHEHLQYDLIADYNGTLIRIQSKFRTKLKNSKSSKMGCKTSHVGLDGKCVERFYTKNDFEIYGIYSPELKTCYYVPNIGQKTITIAEFQTHSYSEIYWYEDFLNPLATEYPKKRKPDSFIGFTPTALKNLKPSELKVKNRPSFDQLKKEIDEFGYCGTGRKYGVSDNAIRKWEKKYKTEFYNEL